MSQIADRYAVALFSLAKEKDCVNTWQKQMQLVRNVLNDKEFTTFLTHYRIEPAQKKELLQKAFGNVCAQEVVHFLMLLVDKKRIAAIHAIAAAFHTLCNTDNDIREGTVYSLQQLTAAEKINIESAVSKKLGCKVDLINRLDSQLIAGVKVIVGDWVMDGSLQNKMQALKSELLKESR